jgi:hypothetical protein
MEVAANLQDRSGDNFNGARGREAAMGCRIVNRFKQNATRLPGIRPPLPAAAIEFDPGCEAKPPVQSVDAALSVRLEHRPVLIGRSGIVTERRL